MMCRRANGADNGSQRNTCLVNLVKAIQFRWHSLSFADWLFLCLEAKWKISQRCLSVVEILMLDILVTSCRWWVPVDCVFFICSRQSPRWLWQFSCLRVGSGCFCWCSVDSHVVWCSFLEASWYPWDLREYFFSLGIWEGRDGCLRIGNDFFSWNWFGCNGKVSAFGQYWGLVVC